MVLHQVEEPLFKAVLDYTQHNQSHAAAMLGLESGHPAKKNSDSMDLLAESEPPKRKRSKLRTAAAPKGTASQATDCNQANHRKGKISKGKR